jgi:Flp pilus assembly protein TadD
MSQGKFEKAARLFNEAYRVAPEDYQAPSFLSMAYAELGREKERIEANRLTLQCAEKHVDLHPDDGRALTFGAYALVELGQPDRAREWAERALEVDRDEPAIIYNVACMYAQLGELDEAISLLGRAIDQGYGHRAWLEHDSDLAPLRGHEKFQQLLDRMD